MKAFSPSTSSTTSLLFFIITASNLLTNVNAGNIQLCAKTSHSNEPIQNAIVNCYDHDWFFDDDDFMTSGTTDQDGCVHLSYRNKSTRWYEPHKWWDEGTSTKPDIFCEVSGECLQPTNTNVKKKHNQNSLADFGTIFVEENNNFCGKGNWNGCGQQELPGWIQHAADSISGFQDQCNLHDVCYSNCDKTRTQCENEFIKDMLGVCNGDWSCEFLADLFHTGVTELGEDSCLADRKRAQCSDDGQNKCFQ
mmetsp:Transcript_41637/g.60943  ORF Transcript_41637/g.60943 Transcript_41637/m.60943 type:complete len:250 (+) Transcript_41637:76-825(+)